MHVMDFLLPGDNRGDTARTVLGCSFVLTYHNTALKSKYDVHIPLKHSP